MKSSKEHSATHRTVIIAGAANIVVGLAKLAAGIISGSSAMLAEAAHSAADTLNQVFLLTSLHQAERPADATTRSATVKTGTSGRCWRHLASSSPEAGSRSSRACWPSPAATTTNPFSPT